MTNELTDEQRAAVESTDDRTLVIAGAGSGKTRVLCHRIKRLIEQGVSPSTIMVLTFTRKAAGEMTERLETMLHKRLGDGLLIGTFHSIALQILRADGDKLGYNPGSITVAPEDDANLLLEHAAELLGYRRDGKWCAGVTLKKAQEFRDSFYNTGEYPRERITGARGRPSPHAHVDADLKRLLGEYHALLFNMNMLDFGRIMIECRRLLTEHPDVRERWSKQIRHVIVDEAQDCDTVQYDLHEFFVPPATVFLVGDRRQCAPGWVKVRTPDGEKRLDQLKTGDRVVSYDRPGKTIVGHREGFAVKVARRPYAEHLLDIGVGDIVTQCTPNHRWLVKWDRRPDAWVTYIMQQGDRFRVGWCQLFEKHGSFHLFTRANIEKADRVWVVGVHRSVADASLEECFLAAKYGIPTIMFVGKASTPLYTQERIDAMFLKLDPTAMRNRVCAALSDHGRSIEYPFREMTEGSVKHRTTVQEIHALNIIPGLCQIPVFKVKKVSEWATVDYVKTSERTTNVVYSLDVTKHHKYIQDGLVTCNSIYSFRGAAPHLMTDRNPAAVIFDLTECFRCGDRIVEAANSLIEHNGDTLAKPMTGVTDRIGVARTFTGRSIDVCDTVALCVRQGYAWSDVAVLARTRKTLRRLATILTERETPHHVVGSRFDVCSSPEFKRLHAALRLSVNPKDQLAFLRLCRDLVMPVSETNACLQKHRDDPLAAMCEALPPMMPDDRSGRGLFSIVLAGRDETLPFTALLEMTINVCCGDMTETHSFWANAHEERNFQSTQEALRWFALRDSHDDLTKDDEVTLSTIHGAKGLEWPTVIIAECQEGTLPSSRSKTPEEILEERRVAYVAMTRAKETLLVHWRRPEDQSQEPGRKISRVSRFVGEAGLSLEGMG